MNIRARQEGSELETTWLFCALLAAAVLIVYFPVYNFDFVNVDDPYYIYSNPLVTSGLTWRGIQWAFSTTYYDFWHPLTWWSHMLDCQMFGLDAGLQHLENVGWHIADTLLIFIVLKEMTGALWRSAFCAALFGLHPIHVESVAWLSERKDVLSTFFWMLSMLGYVRYVREAQSGGSSKSELFYGLALLSFVLALMAKAMVVTLPFVLLLLDYWPLDRFRTAAPVTDRISCLRGSGAKACWRSVVTLVREKLPFFGLTLLSCAVTYSGMKRGGNILNGEVVSWSFRFANIPVSYVRYLWKMVCPLDLAVLYPIPERWELWQVGGAILVLILISWLVFRQARAAPYLVFGWLSFLGTLVPTIGIVAMGYQSIADRYTYIPSIGLFAALVWAVADFSTRWKHRTMVLGTLGVLTLALCGGVCRSQVEFWRNSFTLWTHCLDVNPNNVLAHNNLGFYLQNAGQPGAAINQYRQALDINPRHLNANLNMGVVLANGGRIREATNYFAEALRIAPDNATANLNLGIALFKLGNAAGAIPHLTEAIRTLPDNTSALLYLAQAYGAENKSDKAIQYYLEVLRLDPNNSDGNYYLGCEFYKAGMYEKAISCLNTAVTLTPGWPAAQLQLAMALAKTGRTSEAIAEYRSVLSLSPNSAEACNNLAWALATSADDRLRNGAEAVRLAERACELTHDGEPLFLGTLAAAYAESGRFKEAVATAEQAAQLATTAGLKKAAEKDRQLLELYRAGKPYHEPAPKVQ